MLRTLKTTDGFGQRSNLLPLSISVDRRNEVPMNMKRMRLLPLLIFLLLMVMSLFCTAVADTSLAVQELTVPNTPIKGIIRIDKRGPVLVGFDEHEDANGLTVRTPLYAEGALEGAVYEIRAVEDITGKDGTTWFAAGELADTVTTTADVVAQSRLLPLGHYKVTEVSAPAGYAVDTTRFDVVLAAREQQTPVVSVTVCAANGLVPVRMTLHKEKEIISTAADEKGTIHSAITSEPGDGCVFGLYNSSEISYPNGSLPADSLITTAVSDEDGTVTFEGFFPHGSYYVRELSAPAGWLVDDTCLPIQILDAYRTENGENAIIVEAPVRNEIIHADIKIAKTGITGSGYLPGALIEVKNSDGEIVCRDYTGEDGYLPSFPAVPGSYTFREVLAPEGYALCTTELTFTVHEDGTVTGQTAVADDFTRVSVKKVNQQHEPLEGVVLGLFREDGSLLASAVSDAAGIVTFEKIPYGTYFIQETEPLSGYVKDFTRIPVTVDGTFVNPDEPLAELVNCPTEILLRKVDQNRTALPGAVFGLYDEDGTLVMTAASDAKGLVRFAGAAFGKYIICELTAPEGYLMNQYVVHVTLDEGYTNSDEPLSMVVNQEKKITCIKVDTSGTPMPGIAFSLYNASTMEKVETAISDEDGVFTFSQFDYGDWLIREDATLEGFCPMEDIHLHVGDDWTEPAPLLCVNIPNHYEFLKVDNSGTPLAGVKFRLEDANHQEVGTFVSDKDGIVHVTGLQRGTYTIREIETLEGYSVTGEVIQLKVDESFTLPQEMRKLVNYTVIQTGVNLTVTGVMWAGIALMVVSGAVGLIRKRRTAKRRHH